MMESGIAHAWVMGIIVLAVILALISVGGFMLYSAITGKGITEPKKDEPGGLYVQYKLRGIIGLSFIIFGIFILYGIFNFLF